MKLSNAQQKVIEEIKSEVDNARKYAEYDDYFEAVDRQRSENAVRRLTAVEFKIRYPEAYERATKSWERKKSGIVVTGCINSKTLYKLVEVGAIELLEDGKNNAGIDVVRIINY